MRITAFFCAAILLATMPTAALADDPRDAAMRDAAARAHDREMTRQLKASCEKVGTGFSRTTMRQQRIRASDLRQI